VRASLALLVFAGALGYRYLTLQLTNDDYMFIALGRQIAAFGEWPVIDVFERGDPLQKVASAAVQAVAGYRLAGEVTLDLLVLSGAAVLTFIVAAEVAKSPAIGFVMAAIAVLATPRLYAYPKVALPVGALWLFFRYLEQRTTGSVMSLGAITAFAFLFRHDLGAFTGALCVSGVLLTQLLSRSRPITELVAFTVPIMAIVVPYLALVELHGGVVSYFQSARTFVERDVSRSDDPRPAFTFDRSRPWWERTPPVPVKIRWAPHVTDETRVALEREYALRSGRQDQGRTWTYTLHDTGTDNLLAILAETGIEDTDNIDRTLPRAAGGLTSWERIGRRLRAPPNLAIAPGVLNRGNAVAWLYYLLHALPYLASIVFVVLVIRGAGAAEARIVPAIVYCMVATPFLVRGNLYENARLSDVMTPSVVLGAWLASMAFRRRGSTVNRSVAWGIGALAAVVVLLTLGSVTAYASIGRRIENLPFLAGRGSAVAHIRSQTTDLLSSPPPLTWLSPQTAAYGAVTYLRACTAPGDRLFVYGFYPELFFFSGRGSAGNPPIHLSGLWRTPAEQRRTVDTLSRHRVPIALIDATPAGGFSRDLLFPVTHPIVHEHLLDNFERIGITDFGGSTDVRYEVWAHKGWAAIQTPQWSPLPCAPQ
jgi:hypothetical protein